MRLYVIDTSYLHEMYALSGETPHTVPVDARVAASLEAGDVRVVPIVDLLELGNQIGRLGGQQARRTALQVRDDIEAARNPEEAFYRLFPVLEPDAFAALFRGFAETVHTQATSLVDFAVADAARAEKRRRPHDKVHIWTLDRALKAFEPDWEDDAYVGASGQGSY